MSYQDFFQPCQSPALDISDIQITKRRLVSALPRHNNPQPQTELTVKSTNDFNLSRHLVEKFGISRNLPTVDWKQTSLYQNLKESPAFNHSQNPNLLTEDQVTYCINLLRYCRTEFTDDGAKTEQMFALTMNTLKTLYSEMGLPQQYDRLKARIGAKEVCCEMNEKLLVRCQILLAIRGEAARILN